MALPHTQITPIPDNEPDAVPSLWNTRYAEIDENFQNLDQRTGALESEVQTARGGKSSLDARLDEMEAQIEGLDPETQNALISEVMESKQLIALAFKEIKKTLEMRLQEGEIIIYNRGVISGCTVSKSSTATRNLNLASGKFFMHGRTYSVGEMLNTAAVPANTSAVTKICYAFIWVDSNGEIHCDCTNLDEETPEYGLKIAEIIVPPGNDENSDPYLQNVNIVDARRIEPDYPNLLINPSYKEIVLNAPIPENDYRVNFEIIEYEGAKPEISSIIIDARMSNGFRIYAGCSSDKIKLRYLVSKPLI